MKVNMFITSTVVKDNAGEVKVQACNRMVFVEEGKVVDRKIFYKPGVNSSVALLNAYVYGLRQLDKKCEVEIHTDVQYLVYTTNQIKTWSVNNYINNYGRPCKNKTKLKALLSALEDKGHDVKVVRHPINDKYMTVCKNSIRERLLKKVKVA